MVQRSILSTSGWKVDPPVKNKWVANGEKLLALLMKGEVGFKGIKFMAWGAGEGAWDVGGIPTPDYTQSLLVDEVYRKGVAWSDITFRDGDASGIGAPTVTKGPKILITSYLDSAALSPGQWLREQALFCGDATVTADTGYMYSVNNFAALKKEDFIQVKAEWMLYFEFGS
ncbi:hypothetical protein DRO66_01870 [Candidatus Bathyarchaeota archaeon]|nr:MAG: hypothetical protein DRO66_01870 [Candidatus Bathyarchaeota archaeon]